MNRKFEGIWIPREVWLSEELTLQEKIFLVEISSLDNANGCYANNEYFSKFFGISKTRVSNVINSLVQKGMLTSYINVQEGNKRYLKTLIQFSLRPSYRNVQDPLKLSCKDNNTVNNTSNNTVTTPYEESVSFSVPSDVSKQPEEKENTPRCAAPPKRKRTVEGGSLFSESPFADVRFMKSVFEGTDYELADLDYYHDAVQEWAMRKQVKKIDWKRTIENWIWKDYKDKRMRTKADRISATTHPASQLAQRATLAQQVLTSIHYDKEGNRI